jgi:hypothetical protein
VNLCPVCGGFVFRPGHICPPAWECIRIYGGEVFDPDTNESETIYALDAEDAAERYVSKNWQFEGADEWKVLVRPGDDFSLENWQAFQVTVELVPEFSAELVSL